jgi:hypothetical protein
MGVTASRDRKGRKAYRDHKDHKGLAAQTEPMALTVRTV